MSSVLIVGAAWLLVAAAIALLVARSIHLADSKAVTAGRGEATDPNVVVDPVPVDDDAVDAVVPAPAAFPNLETSSPGVESRTSMSRASQGRSMVPASRPPVIGGCVSASERTPSSRESGAV